MTFRSLLLNNALMAFVMALCGKLSEKVSLESIMNLLFERSGSRIENGSEILYWVNSEGLSLEHRRELTRIVEGINGLELKHKGKAVRVRLREAPT